MTDQTHDIRPPCRMGKTFAKAWASAFGFVLASSILTACIDTSRSGRVSQGPGGMTLAGPGSADPASAAFDHFLTGFPLEGAHNKVACESCHDDASASFRLAATGCVDCHNGVRAEGKDQEHFITNVACESCHEPTNRWIRVRFSHSSPSYPGDHRGNLDCLECHLTNNQFAVFEFPQFGPDCAGCHADDFDPGEHDQGLAELRDCSGACHDDDDVEFGEHRVTDGDFDVDDDDDDD